MKRLLMVAIALMQSGLVAAQTSDRSCCELKILSMPESPARLEVTLTNLNAPSADVVVMRAEVDFGIRLTSGTGEQAGRTEYGRRLLSDGYDGSVRKKELKAGESLTQRLDLARIFELKSGTYKVELTRELSVGGVKVRLRAVAEIKFP
jgi:hypothetical protein